MHFTRSIAALFGLAAMATASPIAEDEFDLSHLLPRQETSSCVSSGVHVIAAPGQGLTPPQMGMLQSLVDRVMQAIPGSDYVQLPYPLPQNSTDGKRITTEGAKMMRQYINSYHRSCRQAQMVLLGYSAGAVITLNAVCGAAAPYDPVPPMRKQLSKFILATIGYGDQTFAPNQPYNEGTCTNGGRYPRTNTAACKNFEANFQNYCDYQDPQCCQGGNDQNQHYVYGQEYDGDATNFIVGKWNAYLAKQKS